MDVFCLKDHVVFTSPADGAAGAGGGRIGAAGFRVKLVSRDNNGDGTFLPEAPFPTLRFPSDHAVAGPPLFTHDTFSLNLRA